PEQPLAARETLGAPDLAPPVVLAHGARTGGDHDPGLLRLGVDVDIGLKAIRLIERAYAHEAQRIPRAGVGAPEGHPARRAAGNLLALAAVARRHHELGTSLKEHHAIGLDNGVERKGSAALGPAAGPGPGSQPRAACRAR